MKKFLLTVLASFLLLPLLPAATVEIRAVSDLHGRLENLARLESLLKPHDPELLRIDAGDSAAGGFEAQKCGLSGVLQIFQELRFDVWVPGNHDLESGEEPLAAAVRNFHGSVLGAEWRSQRLCPESWKLFIRNGFRLAVIGLGDPGMRRRHSFRREFTFQEHAAALARVMPEVRRARPDLIILVRHSGLYDAREPLYQLLRPYPEIQLVIGGHTHQRIPGVRVGGAWFVQPGCRGETAAIITAEFDDRSRRLIRLCSALTEGRGYDRKAVSASPALTAALSDSRRRKKVIVGQTETPLYWPNSRRDRRAALGVWAAGLLLRAVPEADLACFALPVRQEAKSLTGKITALELFHVFPYENRLRLVTLTPQTLKLLLSDKDFCRYTVPFWAGKNMVCTAKGWRCLEQEKKELRLVTTEYLAASHSLLRCAPGRTLPLTDLAAAAQVLAAGK